MRRRATAANYEAAPGVAHLRTHARLLLGAGLALATACGDEPAGGPALTAQSSEATCRPIPFVSGPVSQGGPFGLPLAEVITRGLRPGYRVGELLYMRSNDPGSVSLYFISGVVQNGEDEGVAIWSSSASSLAVFIFDPGQENVAEKWSRAPEQWPEHTDLAAVNAVAKKASVWLPASDVSMDTHGASSVELCPRP